MYLVAAWIDDVGSERQRVQEDGGGPGIVDGHHRAGPVRGRGDRRKVLDLEGERAGRFQVDEPGVGADQRRDAGADARVVVLGLDAKPAQQALAKATRWPVDGVHHQQVVARPALREHGGRNRGNSGRQGDGMIAALQLRQGFLERVRGRRSEAAVMEMRRRVPLLHGLLQRRHGRKQHGRGVIDGRVDRASLLGRNVAEAQNAGVDGKRLGGFGGHSDFLRRSGGSGGAPAPPRILQVGDRRRMA